MEAPDAVEAASQALSHLASSSTEPGAQAVVNGHSDAFTQALKVRRQCYAPGRHRALTQPTRVRVLRRCMCACATRLIVTTSPLRTVTRFQRRGRDRSASDCAPR